jgi:hypothetical protein
VAIPSITEGEAPIDETTTAPDNNPFTASLDRTLNQQDQTNHALASQTSSFENTTDDLFTVAATGETRYSATGLSGIVFAESHFEVQFTLAEQRNYSLSGSGSFVDTSGGASAFLVTLTGPGGSVASFTKADFNPGNDDGATVSPPFSTSGTLDAGTYTLIAQSGVSGGTNLNEIVASYDIDFTASAEVTPPPPPGIPLPAGVGPGMAVLAAMGAWRAARVRFAAA